MNNVSLATQAEYLANNSGGGRCATLRGFTLGDFERAFGPPHYDGDIDGKVSKVWAFNTPRGMFTVHDYWWNEKDELSVGARVGYDFRQSRKVALWARNYFNKVEGLTAS